MFKEKFQLEESVEGSNTPVQKLALVSTVHYCGNLLATVLTYDSHSKTLANACISSTDFSMGSALTS